MIADRWSGAVLLAIGLAALVSEPLVAIAQTDAPATYTGDLWSRPRLTGDWWESRDWLAKRGVTLDLDLLQVLQGVGTGGRDTGVAYDGLVNYELNLDTGKLGLWPGGFLKVKAFTGYGDTVDQDSGAIMPVNMLALLPQPDNPTTSALMNLTFTQFLSKWFGVYAGKMYTLGGDDNAFAHNYNTQFLNTALNFNTTLGFAPWSAYGGGIAVLPWDGAIFTASVLDPSGTATNNDISEAFSDGVAVGAEGRVTIKPFGLVGHQDLGFFWSNKTHTSLEQDPSNLVRGLLNEQFPRLQNPGPILQRILERFFPELLVPVAAAQREEQHLERVLQLRPVPVEPRGGPESRGGRVLPLRRLRRQSEPGQVRLQCRRQRQRHGPGAPQGHPRGRLGPHPVQQRLRSVPAREARSRPQRRGRGRDLLQRGDHAVAEHGRSICRSWTRRSTRP